MDHFGPTRQTDGMVVAAHPHTGLQTVTWLFEGRVEHRDSVGSIQNIEPGQVNFMTAGRGISHSELSIRTNGNLHGVQLWLALPESVRHVEPFFEYHAILPVVTLGEVTGTVFAGNIVGVAAPTTMFTDSFGAEFVIPAGATITVPLDTKYEVGALVVSGAVTVNGVETGLTEMAFAEPGRNSITMTAIHDARVVLLGGSPFAEPLVMWWNFVERTHAEIREAREQWNAEDPRFGSFTDNIGARNLAPDLPNVTLQPR